MRMMVFSAAAAAALGVAGCRTVEMAGGPMLASAGYSYQVGRASQGFPASVTQVQTATMEAFNDLAIDSVRQSHDPEHLLLDAKTVDNRRVAVAIQTQTVPPVVTARIGLLGDEALSKALMDRISIRLGTVPPEAIPTTPPSTATTAGGLLFSRGRRDEDVLRSNGDVGYRDSPIP